MLKNTSCLMVLFIPFTYALSDIYIDIGQNAMSQMSLADGTNSAHLINFKRGYHTYCSFQPGAYKVSRVFDHTHASYVLDDSALNKEASLQGFDFHINDLNQYAGAAIVDFSIKSLQVYSILINCQSYSSPKISQNNYLSALQAIKTAWQENVNHSSKGHFARMKHITKLKTLSWQ